MIIVSQNNENIIKRVVNFDNIICLQIDVIDIKNIVIIYNDVNTNSANVKNDNYVLAWYETKERANEVLQEIINLYKKCEFEKEDYCYRAINVPKVYEMPKE